jgi:hypothetical protein
LSSTRLYHGPGAEAEALSQAHQAGRLLAPPFGGGTGLKVDEARQIVSLLNSTPVGVAVGVVVVGPMDLANDKAADTLLKTIEQFDATVLPILWAQDLGNVRPTIRSRGMAHWCPGFDLEPDDALEGGGRDLVAAALAPDRLYEIPTLAKQFAGREHALMGVMAEALAGQLNGTALMLWERLRPVAELRNPTTIELVAALLPEVP